MKKKRARRKFCRCKRAPRHPGAPMETAARDGRDSGEAMLCAIRGTGRTLDFALREARETGRRLYLLFVREQRFMTEQDAKRKWQEDPEAREIFEKARARAPRTSAALLLRGERFGLANDRRHRRHARRVAPHPRRPAAATP